MGEPAVRETAGFSADREGGLALPKECRTRYSDRAPRWIPWCLYRNRKGHRRLGTPTNPERFCTARQRAGEQSVEQILYRSSHDAPFGFCYIISHMLNIQF